MTKKLDYLKLLGKDSTLKPLTAPDSACNVDFMISTGCSTLDWICGGGLPSGRITEIHGDYSTGKSLVATQVVSQVQHAGGTAIYLDSETAVSLEMMANLGVDVDALIYAAPDSVEEVFTLIEQALDARIKALEEGLEDPESPFLIVWDSVAATTTLAEAEEGIEKFQVGIHARMISKGLRKITRKIGKAKAVCLFLNQIRSKIGGYGDSTTTFGGKAIDFYSSIRIRLTKSGKLKDGNTIIGVNTKAVVIKSRMSAPYREVELPIFFGFGVNEPLSAYAHLSNIGVLTVKGGWGKITLGGKEIAVQKNGNWLEVFDEHYQEITKIILESK